MASQKTVDIGFTLDDFAALLDKYDYHFSPGDVVAGTVFSLEPRGALIDIGAKTAAYILTRLANFLSSPMRMKMGN
jgi:small subunit ribosomal protein S1